MDPKLKEVAKAKQEEGKVKQTDALIKSIVALNKNFVKSNKTEDDKKKSTLGNKFTIKTLVDAFKQKGSGKLKSIKDIFSIQNVLSTLGQGKGTVLGEIAENRANTIKEKLEAGEKKKKSAEVFATESEGGIAWKKKYEEAMDKGDALSEDERIALTEEYNKLLQAGNDLYEKRLTMEKRISELEKSEQDAESVGIVVSEEKRIELRKLKEEYSPHETVKKADKKQSKWRGAQFLKGTATIADPATKKIASAPREGAPSEDMMSVLERKIAAADRLQYPELYPEEAGKTTSPVESVEKKHKDARYEDLTAEEAGKTTSPVESVEKKHKDARYEDLTAEEAGKTTSPVESVEKKHKDARYEDLTAEEAMGLSLADMAEVVQMVLKRDPESGLPDTVRFMHKDTVDARSAKWEKTPMVGTAYEPLRNKKDPTTPLTMPEAPELGVSKEIEDKFIAERNAYWKEKYKDTPTAPTGELTDDEKSKEILEALNRLVAISTMSEEDRLEAKKPESLVEKIKRDTPANPTEKKSLLDRAKGLADMVKDRGKAILEKAAGGAGSTLMDGAKSLLGGIGIGTLAAGAAAATGLAGAGQALFGEKGVMNGGSGKNFISDFAGDYLGIGVESDEKQAKNAAKLSKPVTTPREIQTAALEQSTSEAASIAAKETAGSNKGPAVVDASVKSVTNNNTVQTKPSPPVRNFEPTFNSRLKSQFA